MRASVIIILICIFCKTYGQTDTIVWEKKSQLPTSISAIQIGHFLIDSDFYVVGGWFGTPDNTFSNNVWRYHITTDTWYQMGNLPFGGASSSCSFVFNGKGYFLTARDSASNFSCDNMFWEYDPSGDRWTQLANYPFDARQNSSFFVYGGKAYVGQTFGCSSVDTQFWEYDPVLNQWSAIAVLPSYMIGGSTAIAVPTASAYILCGYDQNGFYNDMWKYNILSNHWDSIGRMPGSPRAFPILWNFDSLIIGGGGEDGVLSYSDFYRYNIFLNLWTPIVFQNFIDSVIGVTFTYDNTAYYFGGPTDAIGNTNNISIWSFDASKFITDTPTGIADLKNDIAFSIYPNPASHEQAFSISTLESGSISFYDALGRMIDERKLAHGINQVKLPTEEEVIFYRATLQYGAIENGKVVFLK